MSTGICVPPYFKLSNFIEKCGQNFGGYKFLYMPLVYAPGDIVEKDYQMVQLCKEDTMDHRKRRKLIKSFSVAA